MENKTGRTILRLERVSKSFQGVRALNDVALHLRAGEIHALMGENGAGKSTLIKVLTGVHARDAGEMSLDGQPIAPGSTRDAQALGISTVYQEVNLVPALSVAENIFLGREPKRLGGLIDWKAVHDGAERALARLKLSLDVERPLEDYSVAIQQLTAIARALDMNARVLILDEATSSLDAAEVARLFDILRDLKEGGMAILFVTHFLDQVYATADRMTVLRNGEFVGEYLTADLPRLKLIEKMMGRELEQLNETESLGPSAADRETVERRPWLECVELGRAGAIEPFTLEIRAGEVLGLAGLLGSGRTELARLLFGLDLADQGRVKVDGREVRLTNPREAIRHGFAFSPEDRKVEGIFPQLSVRENIVVALQARRGWFRTLSRARQNELADKYIKALRIRARDADQPIQTLSGGNQQKAILARWLAMQPRLLVLDEPTRGIDVGAKAEIQKLVAGLRDGGTSLVFISSELDEVVRLADRIAVLKERRKIGELDRKPFSEKQLMRLFASAGPASEFDTEKGAAP